MGDATPMHLPGARHPLLMAPALPKLPKPPSSEDAAFDRNFQAPPSWMVPSGMAAAGQMPASGVAGAQLPRPLDLRVPPNKAVVAITGPNTGGKTVALKTAGLLALMAKAGLFVPVDCSPGAEAAEAEAGQLSSSGSDIGKGEPSHLRWFDSILADIGDAQSLQQNLSTFSGHVRRLRRVLSAATPLSLVLLDEGALCHLFACTRTFGGCFGGLRGGGGTPLCSIHI